MKLKYRITIKIQQNCSLLASSSTVGCTVLINVIQLQSRSMTYCSSRGAYTVWLKWYISEGDVYYKFCYKMNHIQCSNLQCQTALQTLSMCYSANEISKLRRPFPGGIHWHWNIYYAACNSAALPTFVWTGKHAVRMLSDCSFTTRYTDNIGWTTSEWLGRHSIASLYSENILLFWSNRFRTHCGSSTTLSLVCSSPAREQLRWS